MEKKIAIITGASSGFGFLSAISLAKQGYIVYATMRNLEKAVMYEEDHIPKEIRGLIHIHQLDVTDGSSVQEMKDLVSSIGRADVLVNNAGFAGGGFCEEITVQEYRNQFETNVFGVMAVTQAILPVMREQGFGKILNMSSISGRVGFPGVSPYASSKFALEGYSESLRLEMKPYGVQVALIEPGSFKTNIWSSGKQVSEKSQQASSPYASYMERINKHLDESKDDMGDPQDVADLIVTLAEQNELKKLRYPVGKGVSFMLELKKWLPWNKWEREILKRL
ncbi:oxidoreductase [Pontibacillus marinus]|uniref:Short-chain dehydrogenase n=1 Tax=Pontibacillus marinus BH030004 = DSM 16465 TaxID=1385511 RepID=A0A0A5HML3_9BACI|nr:oxidoreductase [Pontibacillus marinus]KGX84862.1 short-chain dehydrogenase [Pontibacillus marinus BH030004 = DSM 16465]